MFLHRARLRTTKLGTLLQNTKQFYQLCHGELNTQNFLPKKEEKHPPNKHSRKKKHKKLQSHFPAHPKTNVFFPFALKNRHLRIFAALGLFQAT